MLIATVVITKLRRNIVPCVAALQDLKRVARAQADAHNRRDSIAIDNEWTTLFVSSKEQGNVRDADKQYTRTAHVTASAMFKLFVHSSNYVNYKYPIRTPYVGGYDELGFDIFGPMIITELHREDA